MKTFPELGAEIGELVERKNAAYGSSFAAAGGFLRLLYPDGLMPSQYDDALLLVRIFDKQKRIATDRDALGESPYADISGYGILGAHLHQERKAVSPCGNASGPDASNPSEARQPDSADRAASEKISPSASVKIAIEPLPQPDGCSTPLTSAPAKTAMEVASPSEGAQRRTERNDPSECAWCHSAFPVQEPIWNWKTRTERFCSESCAIAWGASMEAIRR